MAPTIVLASGSLQRKILLQAVGWDFQVLPAPINEQEITTPLGSNRALYLATMKAECVSQMRPESIVIAADTIVLHESTILEKPQSKKRAIAMLHQLSGQNFEVQTGVAMRYKDVAKSELVMVHTRMRKLSDQEITQYVQLNPVTTWSAGFSPAYPAGMGLLASVTGSFTALTHGLPIEVVANWLSDLNIK